MASARKRKAAAQPAAQGTGGGALAVKARYDAAGTGRRMRGWHPPTSGPNRAITGLQKIRDRARDAGRNDWSGESSTQHWTTNLIGIGIVPRLRRITSKTRKAQLNDLWDDWVPQADADGVLNFYGLQTLAVRSWLESGEVFARLRPRQIDAPLAVPLQVQLIEADFVPLLDADYWPGMPAGNTIRQGIERNKYGRRVAYWMYRDHPGDGPLSGAIDASRLLRVPADQVLHMFEPKRPGQLRGVSSLAPILARLRNVADFDDNVLERQKLANLFTVFITRTMPSSIDADTDPMTGFPVEWGSDGLPLAGLEPGMSQELDPGQDVRFSDPPDAGAAYPDFMRTQHLGTAAGQGLPYELFSGDIKEVSDRTLRVIINEFRRFAEQRQWQIVIPMLCQPIRDAWVDAGVLSGAISVEEADDAKRVEWAPHGWQYIHPVQDVQGKQIEVNAGFRSRSSVVSERGDDPEKVDQERADDKARANSLGLTPPDGKEAEGVPPNDDDPAPKKARQTGG
ncbi:phage portal protein [Cupriavidus necator]